MANENKNELLALIIGEVIKTAPALVIDIVQVLNSEGTDADWAALRAKWDKPASSFYGTPPQAPP